MEWKGTKISKVELDKILASHNHEVDEDITNYLYPIKAVQLDDGRMVIMDEFGGIIYETKEDLLKLFYDTMNYKEPEIPQDFEKKVPLFIKKLNDQTDLGLTMYDRLENLVELDSALRNIDIGHISRNLTEYLLPIVAYCGQIICNETKGQWQIREHDGKVRAFVIGKDQKIYYPYNVVIKHIVNEVNESFSLTGIIEYEINPISLD